MAPLDPDVIHRSNTLPLALFGGQIALVAGLTTHILRTIYRAARSLPPAAATRAQEPVRRRNVAIFSTLALLSIASVTTFAVAWRVLSYFEWADKGSYESPGSLWTGWYGTGDEGVGRWRLGDWWGDVDMIEEFDARIMAAPEAFLYMYQHFCGLTAAAIFFGVEGRRRNVSPWTIASFVGLSAVGSLGFALNLFFVTMLFTPLALHHDSTPRHDTLFTPKPVVYYIPVVASLVLEQSLPDLLAHRANLNVFRTAYVAVPMFLAFAPQIIPVSWGNHHPSKASAHRSFVRAFYVLGLASLALHWKQFATSVFVNTPPEKSTPVYDLFRHAIGKYQERPNRLLTAFSNTAERLKVVSTHPAISVTGNDVAFTAIGLLVWTFVRQLDVQGVLDNSVLSFLVPHKSEKHVAFEEKVDEAAEQLEGELHPTTTPKKRGRPRKNTANDDHVAATPSSTGTLRRSTRRKTRQSSVVSESEAEDAYEPTTQTTKAIQQIEADVPSTTEDLLEGGESTALGLLLAFTGGLGQLAAAVLGAEVTAAD